MDLSEVTNGLLCVFYKRQATKIKKYLQKAILTAQCFPWSFLMVLSAHWSLGYNIWGMRNTEILGKYWLLSWAITASQYICGSMAFGQIVLVTMSASFGFNCTQKTQQRDTAMRPHSWHFWSLGSIADAFWRMRCQLDGSPASAGLHHPPSICVFCFGEWRPVQLNIVPAQKTSDKR